MSVKYIAAIDQGTTSTRCILFDRSGRIKGQAGREHRQIFPAPGRVEHDAAEIWTNTCRVVRDAVSASGVRSRDIAAVGITNQRETTLVFDPVTARPRGNAIVWQDTRTSGICDRMAGIAGRDRFVRRTGLPIATYFSGPKLKWMIEEKPSLAREAEAGRSVFATMDSWLVWNLTGGPRGGRHVTDVTNASRTMMMNIRRLDWDRTMLRAFGIPARMLPAIGSSSDPDFFGRTVKSGPFGAEIPVTAVLGDQQAALFGQACFDPGTLKSTYGTGAFLLMNTGNRPVYSRNGLITTVGYRLRGSEAVYALEGSVAVAGALVQWLRDNLGLIKSSKDIESLAAGAKDNGGVYFVPAFSGLYAPYWRSDARGLIAGLTRYADRRHLARAVLEATAFQTRELLEAMEKDTGLRIGELRVDGGMTANNLLMQFLADCLAVRVVRPRVAETTALGAAYAAGLAVGFWKDLEEIRANWSLSAGWKRTMNESDRERLYKQWKKAVRRTFGWTR